MRARRLVLFALLAVVGAVAFAGCGAKEGPLSQDEALDLIEQLPESQNLDQFRFEMRVTFDGLDDLPDEAVTEDGLTIDPDELSMVVEGGFDEPNDRSHFRFAMEGFSVDADGDPLAALFLGDDFSMEMLQDGDESWVRIGFLGALFGVDGDTWIHTTGEGGDFFDAGDEFAFDREDLTGFMESFEGEIEVIGLEEVRGAEVTHILLTVDPEAIEDDDEVWGDIPEGLEQLDLHVWIDDAGRLHQVQMTVPFDAGDLPFGELGEDPAVLAALEDATMTFTMSFFDYDQPLQLDVPPEGEIVSEDELEGLFGGGFDDDFSPDGDDAGDDFDGPFDDPQFRFFELLGGSPWLEPDFEAAHPELAEELNTLVDEAFAADAITDEHVAELEDLLARIEEARAQ